MPEPLKQEEFCQAYLNVLFTLLYTHPQFRDDKKLTSYAQQHWKEILGGFGTFVDRYVQKHPENSEPC
jgi:hypothetical protein